MKGKFLFPVLIILLLTFTYLAQHGYFYSKKPIISVDAYVVSDEDIKSRLLLVERSYSKDIYGDTIQSTIRGLYILREEIDDCNFTTKITIHWGNLEKNIKINTTAFEKCNWRPKYSGFSYYQYLKNKIALHYVDIKKRKGGLLITDKVIKTRTVDNYSDVSWSEDGRFFSWSYFSRIDIYKFGTPKSWSTKLLTIHNGEKNEIIKCPTPPMVMNIQWVKGYRYLYFELFNNEKSIKNPPLYQGTIELSQFALNN